MLAIWSKTEDTFFPDCLVEIKKGKKPPTELYLYLLYVERSGARERKKRSIIGV